MAHTGRRDGGWGVAPGGGDQEIKAVMEAQEENKAGTRGDALMWISLGVCVRS